MMFAKISLILLCLTTIVSVSNADVQPGAITSATPQGLQSACTQTVQNCQSSLNGVSGTGSLTAILLNLQLGIVIAPLLSSLVILLTPLLSTLTNLVCELLAVVLAALAQIITLVVKLLSGVLSQSDYNNQVQQWQSNTSTKVNSYSNTGLSGVIAVVLNLLSSILSICININIGLLG